MGGGLGSVPVGPRSFPSRLVAAGVTGTACGAAWDRGSPQPDSSYKNVLGSFYHDVLGSFSRAKQLAGLPRRPSPLAHTDLPPPSCNARRFSVGTIDSSRCCCCCRSSFWHCRMRTTPRSARSSRFVHYWFWRGSVGSPLPVCVAVLALVPFCCCFVPSPASLSV